MEELILVRHGYPEHLVDGRTGGWTESHPTDLGREQAKRTGPAVARILGEKGFAFYSSDLPRARETAHIVAESLSAYPTFTQELREKNNGRAANLTVSESERFALPATKPVVDCIPYVDAESWRMVIRRIGVFLDHISNEGHETVLLVSHAEAGIGILYWWLRLPAESWPGVQFEFDLCSITQLVGGEWEGRRILRLNDISHLEDLPT